MKHLIYSILIIIAAFLGFFCGANEYYYDTKNKLHFYNTKESLKYERQYSNAVLEALHWYMKGDTIYWKNVFMKTKEYHKIDSINEGDWEDFYAPNWK